MLPDVELFVQQEKKITIFARANGLLHPFSEQLGRFKK